MVSINIVWINLDKQVLRRKRMEESLAKLSIPSLRYPAVDGYKLKKKLIDKVNSKTSRNLLPGEIGCLLSHKNVWKWGFKNKKDYLWIMEDDISLESNLEPIEIAINKLDIIDPNWGLLYIKELSSTSKFYEICNPDHITSYLNPYKQIIDKKIYKNLYKVGPQLGAYSYILSKKGLEKLNHFHYFHNPVDVHLGELNEIIPTYMFKSKIVKLLNYGFSDTQNKPMIYSW